MLLKLFNTYISTEYIFIIFEIFLRLVYDIFLSYKTFVENGFKKIIIVLPRHRIALFITVFLLFLLVFTVFNVICALRICARMKECVLRRRGT